MYPFERFNDATKRVLSLAQDEAERAHTSYIGTEHILLALLREPNTVAGAVLQALNIDFAGADSIIGPVTQTARQEAAVPHTIPTSRVKTVIELSFAEARAMGDAYVGTEHVLVALLVEGEGIAAHVLVDMGATLEKVRAAVETVRTSGAVVEAGNSAEPSWQSVSRAYRAASPRSGLRFVRFERAGTADADSGPVFVNPADVVAVAQVGEDRASITLRHNDSSTLFVRGSAEDIARQLEQA